MSRSNQQEQAEAEYRAGISGTTPPIATQLCFCTAAPEDGTTGLLTATAIPLPTFGSDGQQSGRHQVSNTGTVDLTNSTGSSQDVTHVAMITAGNVAVGYMALPSTVTLANGDFIRWTAGELTFQDD